MTIFGIGKILEKILITNSLKGLSEIIKNNLLTIKYLNSIMTYYEARVDNMLDS
jgi:hypothetical protein